MVDLIYQKAFSEVLEILRYIPEIDYEKIPLEIIEIMEDNSIKDYEIKYKPTIALQEQNISKEARIIIAIFFRDYWATEEQKNKIILKEKLDLEKLEEEKRKKYKVDDLFKNNKIELEKEKQTEKVQEQSLIEYKENLFTKLINKIKKFFYKA